MSYYNVYKKMMKTNIILDVIQKVKNDMRNPKLMRYEFRPIMDGVFFESVSCDFTFTLALGKEVLINSQDKSMKKWTCDYSIVSLAFFPINDDFDSIFKSAWGKFKTGNLDARVMLKGKDTKLSFRRYLYNWLMNDREMMYISDSYLINLKDIMNKTENSEEFNVRKSGTVRACAVADIHSLFIKYEKIDCNVIKEAYDQYMISYLSKM